jgi:alanine dehydrogenase
MDIGITREVKSGEARVSLTPAAANTLADDGHRIFVESQAGLRAGFGDEEYRAAGAQIVYSRDEAIGRAELVLMVAEPAPEDYALFDEGQIITAFWLLAVQPREAVAALVEKKLTAVGMDIIEDAEGRTPILRAMSEIGGPLAVQMAERFLQTDEGGRGILLGGLPGTAPAHVVILGAGAVGTTATQAALGAGAQVTIFDTRPEALERLHERFGGRAVTRFAHRRVLERTIVTADVLIGAVSIHGARTPALVNHALVHQMKPGSVIVDVAIDAGGCVETSRPTTIAHPIYIEDNVIHCCIPNLPALVARTASYVLANASLPFVRKLAALGARNAAAADPVLAAGYYVDAGRIVKANVAAEFQRAEGRLSGDRGGR